MHRLYADRASQDRAPSGARNNTPLRKEAEMKKAFGWVAALAVLSLTLVAATPAVLVPGDMADVTVTQAKEPVDGVRLIEVTGTSGGETHTAWLMISERNYAKLIGCKRAEDGSGPALQYSDRSQMVNVVVCDADPAPRS
jgi:hypothetical protein